MGALLFCADSIAAVFKGSLDPDPALLGRAYTIIAHPLASTCAMLQLFTKLEVSSFIRSKYMQEVTKFKNSTPGPDHARLRVFCHV